LRVRRTRNLHEAAVKILSYVPTVAARTNVGMWHEVGLYMRT